MRLLERETLLASLAEYGDDARQGEGRLVLVAGEAGVGKTALLERFEQDVTDATWAWGACDGLFTPRPLGPLFDIAAALGGDLFAACEAGASRESLFGALLRQADASDRRLTVLVIEDVHWADEATLDLLRFLGRRLRGTHLLLVATYRDDGLRPDDPLRVVLGELGSHRTTRRITLPPLSEAAVLELAGADAVESGELFRLTGGNPFFLTEVLQAGADRLPASARDAVLARVAALAPDARRVLEAAALTGSRVEPWLLDAVSPAAAAAIDACLASGVLRADEDCLRFRHELARLAVEQAVPVHRRVELHAALLTALRSKGSDDDARLAYHAEGAGHGAAVLEHAPRAARRASELASHREAFAQYERALRFAGGQPPATVAALYDGLAHEASLIDRWQLAADARRSALPLWRAAGDRLREGDTLRLLSRALWRLCRGREAFAAAQEALTVLEPLPPGRELGWAYCNLAGYHMAAGDDAEAVRVARRAQRLAEQLGLADVLSDALNTEGSVQTDGSERGGPAALRRALEVALAAGLDEQAGRAYANLHAVQDAEKRWPEAEGIYLEGVAYCDEHDIATFGTCLRGGHTRSLEQQGRWDQALDLGREALRRTTSSIINRLNPLIGLATVLTRRGDPAATALLEEAVSAADGTEEPGWICSARLARAEAAWLSDRHAEAAHDLGVAAEAARHCDRWMRGAAAVWLQRLGLPSCDGLEPVAEPYALSLAGRPREAAAAWVRLGCPYEAAMALVDAQDDEALREALATFDGLGAVATARLARSRMRALGFKAVPAGPRSTTRSHRFGLTRREHEVLELLCTGLANADISRRLFISERTVDHHVSAVLTKMGVPSRGVAASEAARLGLVQVAAGD